MKIIKIRVFFLDFVRKEVRELLEFLKEPEPEDDAAVLAYNCISKFNMN